jgi:4-amino-4-deoxy-L-arabinose transferase-like glycosyltransferase
MIRKLAPLALLAACVLALYTIALGRAPIYPHEAEVLFALHAHAIATTLHDANGRLLPLYFQMPAIGENVWFHPMIVYTMAPFLTVLPLSEAAIRLPSVLVGLVDVVLVYFVARRIFRSDRWALAAAALLALTPSHFIHSRLAMDYLYPVPLVLAWLLCLLVFLERRDRTLLFAATSFLGIGVYSYIASLVMMPLYLMVTLAVVWRTSDKPVRPAFIAIAGFAWPLCLLLWIAFHPQFLGQTAERYGVGAAAPVLHAGGTSIAAVLEDLRRTVRFSGVTGRLSLYWYFFDPSYLFLTGGYANVVNSTRHVGVFPVSCLVFIPIGLAVLMVGRRSVVDSLLVFGFASAPFAACLVVPEPYAIDRELALLPFGVLIAAVGARYLIEERAGVWRNAGIALLAAVPAYFAFFCYDYYGDYKPRSAFWFNYNRRGAVEDILAREPQMHPPGIYLSTHHIPYVDPYWRFYLIKYGRLDLLERTVLFDSAVFDLRSIPERSLLLVGRDDSALAPWIASGDLREVAQIPEPGEPPFFSVLVRQERATRTTK